MSKYAYIVNNVAVNVVTGNPNDFFHPDIAIKFEIVPIEVEIGWRRSQDTGTWMAPEIVSPAQTVTATMKVSPVEFKLLFTSQERVTIKAARDTDPVIDDFYDIVADPRLTHVDLGLKSTKDALAYMVNIGLIAAERQDEILAGKMQ